MGERVPDIRNRYKISRFCAVYGCYNRMREKRSLYPFPFVKDLRQAWILATGREGFVPTKFSRVCADHFQEKDFTRFPAYRCPKGRKLLRKGAVPTVFDNSSCNERPFPRYSKKVKFNRLAMANATSGTQAVGNCPSSSFPYSQDMSVMEHPLVKQEVLSAGESPSSMDTTHPSTLAFPLKELITKLRSNVPQPPSTSIKVEPEISELRFPDPTPFSPVITDVRPVKPDPDGPDTYQFPSAHSSHQNPDEELGSFFPSSLVDCQLGHDSSPAAAENSLYLPDDSHASSSSSAGDESPPVAAENCSYLRNDAQASSSSARDESSPVAAENSTSLRNDAHASSSSSAGDEFELCDKCGSYTRKVYSATGRPMRKARWLQSNPFRPHRVNSDCHSSCSVVCCNDSMCSFGSNRPVDPRLAKFQAYGKVLADRLHRLPAKTSSLVQSVIEELVFNAEDGMYDGYLSTKGVLKQQAHHKSLKQIGGFNGYDD